jgi:hypothetical protein
MNSNLDAFAVTRQQGFALYALRNEIIEAVVIPELGAKIVSLKNLRTGREWMWHPAGGFKLFRNRFGDEFSRSPLIGIDECFPTIMPCHWQGRDLPDHGEVWSVPWMVDPNDWENGILRTSVALKVSPFKLERTIELIDSEIRLDYRLTNLGDAEESFLWAMHPLLKLRSGDQIVVPNSTRKQFKNLAFIDDWQTAPMENNCAKNFATPVLEGTAAVSNEITGERLELRWNPEHNDTLGLWLTRGGWHGHHHVALEPTNSSSDELVLAVARNHCGKVPAGGCKTWRVGIRID